MDHTYASFGDLEYQVLHPVSRGGVGEHVVSVTDRNGTLHGSVLLSVKLGEAHRLPQIDLDVALSLYCGCC